MRVLPLAVSSCLLGAAVLPILTGPDRIRATAATVDTAPESSRLGPLQTLASPAGSPASLPQLTVDAEGRVLLSWMARQGDGPLHRFAYARLDGAAWQPPVTIAERSGFFVNWADVPAVHLRPDGGLLAHWLEKSGPDTYAYDVRLSLSDRAGRSWQADRAPHRDGTATEHGFVSTFPWPGGGTGVIWLDGRATGGAHGAEHAGAMGLRSARLDPDGRIGDDVLVDDRVCECCPTTAVAVPGGAVIAYRDRSDAEVRDIAVRRLVDGRWTEASYVHADRWTINACPVNGPALAAEGSHVALAWFTAEGNRPRVQVAFSSDSGATFGAPVRVDDVTTLGRVDVVMLAADRALVSWMEFSPGGSELRIREVARDGTRSASRTVTSMASDRASGYPRMVRAGDRVYFAWTVTRPTPTIALAYADRLRQ